MRVLLEFGADITPVSALGTAEEAAARHHSCVRLLQGRARAEW